MQCRTLTGTGIKVSRMTLGTMIFRGHVSESEALKVVNYALDAGVNFIDTADIYNKGPAEVILSKALKRKRNRLVLANKIGMLMGSDQSKDGGLHRRHIIHGVETSLKRLSLQNDNVIVLQSENVIPP